MDSISNLYVSTDKNKLDLPLIHSFLKNSYWAKGRTIEQVKKSIDNSFCFGLYLNQKQIGFARVVTDKVVFAYLMDVFVTEEERGKGLSKLLLQEIFNHPELQSIKTWFLATKDAHGLYEQFGFKKVTDTNKWMKKDARNKNLNEKRTNI